MPNVTLSFDEKLLHEARQYAKKHHTSLNALIRKMLSGVVRNKSQDWLDECFRIMDAAPVSSKGKKWGREDLYDA
jgi:hypothetical protein